jgi:hypothetical protein
MIETLDRLLSEQPAYSPATVVSARVLADWDGMQIHPLLNCVVDLLVRLRLRKKVYRFDCD